MNKDEHNLHQSETVEKREKVGSFMDFCSNLPPVRTMVRELRVAFNLSPLTGREVYVENRKSNLSDETRRLWNNECGSRRIIHSLNITKENVENIQKELERLDSLKKRLTIRAIAELTAMNEVVVTIKK